MHRRLPILVLALIPVLALAAIRGEPLPEDIEAMGVAEAVNASGSLDGQSVVIEGRITRVCQKKGCWAVFAEDEHIIRVMAADHAFAIPADYSGPARAHGVLEREELSAEHVEHLIAEDGADAGLREDPVEIRLIASGVELLAE